MPNSSVLLNPQHVAKIGYNGFDMGQEIDFTSGTGQLLPVYYDILSPGDKVSCKAIIKSRTNPLLQATTMSLKEHVEWFFVPMNQIYSAFGNFFYGVEDFTSSLFKSLYATGKQINSLPYGNLYGIVGIDAWNLLKSQSDSQGDSKARAWFRLADHLGLPICGNIDMQWQDNTGTFPISPLLFAAYQKIYSDYYRISNREENQPATYNLDDFIYNETSTIPYNTFINRFGILRYRPWKRDFFKANQISPLFGAMSVGAQLSTNNLIGGVEQWLSGLSKLQTASPVSASQFPDGGNTQGDAQEPTTVRIQHQTGSTQATYNDLLRVQGAINPANIRSMFAAEKLLEITRRAGKHYDVQTLAHFGIKVPQGIDGEVIYLGEQTAMMQIGDVVSNAATSDAPLGEIAGKGYAYGSGDSCTFEAKSHGILMAIFSCEPDARYRQVGTDKLLTTIDRTDFVIPEYDDLGMQPLFRYQSYTDDSPSDNAIVDGWQWRYMEYKKKYDRVIGGFGAGQSLSAWVNSYFPSISSLSKYYIEPDALNGVMVYNYDKHLYNTEDVDGFVQNYLYAGDPLLHFFYMDVKKSSKMSTYGIPSL